MFKRCVAIPLVLFAAALAAPVCASEAVLYSFTGGADGGNPDSTLAVGPDGALYGTTTIGGANGKGTIFRITTAGALTVLHNFNGSDGSQAGGRLVLGKDGNFYGTTAGGGTGNSGTFYRIAPSGSGFAKLFDFPQTSFTQFAPPLTLGSDGNFYGTSNSGTAGGYIFQLTPAGAFTTLHTFPYVQGGGIAPGGMSLTEGPDHNLYGMTLTTYGEGPGCGTAFKITFQGQLTTIHTFLTNDAVSCPGINRNGLVLGDDGNFYGIAGYGAFSMTPSGGVKLLYSGPAEAGDSSGLAKGSNGTFWGVDPTGWLGGGSVFSVTAGGAWNERYDFGPQGSSDAQNPDMPLVVASDGNAYGLSGGSVYSAGGGAYGKGAVYYITPNSAVALTPKFAAPLSFTRQCTTATALTPSGTPVGGVALTFQTIGVDSTSATETTNVQGTAQYCWTNKGVGGDSLRVSDGKLTDTARFSFLEHNTTMTAYPSLAQLASPLQINLKLSARVMDVSLNVPVVGQPVDFYQASYVIPGVKAFGGTYVCEGYTDASGLASCSGAVPVVSGLLPVLQTTLGFNAIFSGGDEYGYSTAAGTLTTGALALP